MLSTAEQRHTSANRPMRWLATHLIASPVPSSSPNHRIADKTGRHAQHCTTTSHECKQADAVVRNAPDAPEPSKCEPICHRGVRQVNNHQAACAPGATT